MNPAIETIREIEALGARLVIDGERLGVCGQLPPEILFKAKRHKVAILDFLKGCETLGVIHSPETSYTQNTHNTQKPTGQGICADIADSAYRGSKQKATPLSPSDESRIRAWLDYIEEDDPEAIEEVIEKCRLDMEARRYFLGRAEEVPDDWLPDKEGGSPSGVSDHERVTCGDCIHFKRIDHPHLGHCAKGEPEAPAGLWDSDRRYCGNYAPSE